MSDMTEEDAARLDEKYTANPPDVDLSRPGFFARQNDMIVVLDSFTSNYLASKVAATKRTPAELISDMVRHELETAL